jgi:hypothetical protein
VILLALSYVRNLYVYYTNWDNTIDNDHGVRCNIVNGMIYVDFELKKGRPDAIFTQPMRTVRMWGHRGWGAGMPNWQFGYPGFRWWFIEYDPEVKEIELLGCGFGWEYPYFSSNAGIIVEMPLWLLLIPPLLAQWLDRRNRRPLESSCFCLKCGYDLRASKERCPECGTPIPLRKDFKPPQTDPPPEALPPT